MLSLRADFESRKVSYLRFGLLRFPEKNSYQNGCSASVFVSVISGPDGKSASAEVARILFVFPELKWDSLQLYPNYFGPFCMVYIWIDSKNESQESASGWWTWRGGGSPLAPILVFLGLDLYCSALFWHEDYCWSEMLSGRLAGTWHSHSCGYSLLYL